MTPTEHLIRYFTYEHLPTHLQDVSRPFADMASWIRDYMPEGIEKTACLRKLLEAKDCAVRAALDIEEPAVAKVVPLKDPLDYEEIE